MNKIRKIRKQFPACKKYVYLNPAGGSPVSKNVYKAASTYYHEMLHEGDTLYETWLDRTENVRKKLADFIGAGEDEVLFTANTSHGMNLIALMLNKGDEIITMEDEFPSSTIPWIHHGYKVRFVQPDNHIYSAASIEKVITPQTNILVASYVQFNTGFRQDLKMLEEICRKHRLIFVLNATQAMGVFPLDMKALDVDFMVFTGLKWPMAGYGIGGMYINRKHLGKLHFAQAGWQSVEHPESMDNKAAKLPHVASVMEPGVPHFPNIFALGAALDLLDGIGHEKITNHIMKLNEILVSGLIDLNLEIISPLDPLHRSGITVVKVPDPGNVVEKLAAKNIIVAARGEGIRISVHVFNNAHDVEKLLKSLNSATKKTNKLC